LIILFLIFFAFMTLNRSKSVILAFLSLASIFLAHRVAAHFVLMSAFSQAFRTYFWRALCGNLRMKSVSCMHLKGMACLLTRVQGPSTKALF
ncbi:hypothetical protein OFC38_29195, partial [Escherichia coli]|nr:hypothetical protein [Escherichia coli]